MIQEMGLARAYFYIPILLTVQSFSTEVRRSTANYRDTHSSFLFPSTQSSVASSITARTQGRSVDPGSSMIPT